MRVNEVTREIVDAAYRIHATLGPGLLESVYELILFHELQSRDLRCRRQQAIPVVWRGLKLEGGYRADLLVENCVIVEIKSIEEIHPVHKKQVLTYLRVAKKKVGLLLNFGAPLMKEGIFGIVNGL